MFSGYMNECHVQTVIYKMLSILLTFNFVVYFLFLYNQTYWDRRHCLKIKFSVCRKNNKLLLLSKGNQHDSPKLLHATLLFYC